LSDRIEPAEIIVTVERQLAALLQLSELEQLVIDDARSGWNKPLADRLAAEIGNLFNS